VTGGAGFIGRYCVRSFLEKINQNKPLEIFGNGLQTRDFIAIHDVVNSFNCALSKIENKHGRIYNIAYGKSITIKDLAKIMISTSGKDLEIIYNPAKIIEIKYSQADISLAKKELNFIPKVDFKEEIKNLM